MDKYPKQTLPTSLVLEWSYLKLFNPTQATCCLQQSFSLPHKAKASSQHFPHVCKRVFRFTTTFLPAMISSYCPRTLLILTRLIFLTSFDSSYFTAISLAFFIISLCKVDESFCLQVQKLHEHYEVCVCVLICTNHMHITCDFLATNP